MKEYEFHEYADIFPLMNREELKGLEQSIKNKYLKQYPILLYEGKILDGRNRYNICKKIKIEATFSEFKGTEKEAIDFVWASNYNRRNLTAFQKLEAIDKYQKFQSDLAKKRQQATQLNGRTKDNQPKYKSSVVNSEDTTYESKNTSKGKTRDIIAKKVKVSPHTVDVYNKAKKLKEENPKFKKKYEDVKKGTITIKEIEKEIKKIENKKDDLKQQQLELQIKKEESLLEGYARKLKGKTDIEIFRIFGNKKYGNDQPKLSDYWRFQKGDHRLGKEYPGRTWGNELMNIIYRFSKQGDLVLDPMAGGGVCNDVCLIMNRKCISYDIKPCRDDIIKKDVQEPFESDHKKVDLVFWDPPYHKKLEKEYDVEASTEDKQTFLDYINKVASNLNIIMKKDKYLALLFSQYIDYDNEFDSVLGLDYAQTIEKNGFKLVLEIQSPLTFNNQYQPHDIKRAKKEDPWKILPVSRSWYIFKKVK